MAKPLKDVDSASQALCLGSFVRFFPLLGILGYLLGGWTGVAAAAAACAGTAVFSVWISGRRSTLGVNFLYGMRPPLWSQAEQLEGDLNRARVHKMNARFDQALEMVDTVLAQYPDFAEALLLKAQILWEGYRDQAGARLCLIPHPCPIGPTRCIAGRPTCTTGCLARKLAAISRKTDRPRIPPSA